MQYDRTVHHVKPGNTKIPKMATDTRKKEQHISSCNIHLNGRVAPHVQAYVIKEMFKYLVFQRNQIPMAFEQLQFEYQRQATPANSTSVSIRYEDQMYVHKNDNKNITTLLSYRSTRTMLLYHGDCTQSQ